MPVSANVVSQSAMIHTHTQNVCVCVNFKWVEVAQERIYRQASMNMVMNKEHQED